MITIVIIITRLITTDLLVAVVVYSLYIVTSKREISLREKSIYKIIAICVLCVYVAISVGPLVALYVLPDNLVLPGGDSY